MEATEKPIEITVAANAGVMIRAGNTVILADVLEDAGPYPFDRLPDSVLSQMAEGQNPWRNAQYLIFTHEHPDHFAPDLVRRYLSRNTVRRLVLPNRPDKENQALLSELRESRAPVWALPDEIGKRHTFVLQKDILLHTACTPTPAACSRTPAVIYCSSRSWAGIFCCSATATTGIPRFTNG